MTVSMASCWQKKKRFWTDEDFPQAQDVCCKIKAQLAKIGKEGDMAAAAREKLDGACPDCPAA